MRQAIARRMTESKQQAPHFYVETDVVMDPALSLAKERGVTVTAVLALACARALRMHPALNAVWTARGVERSETVNLGVAVALDDGLIAPAVLGASGLNLDQMAEALTDVVNRARAGKLRGSELTQGTFTVSNLGMFDVTKFIAIVVPPQVAILATGRTIARVVEFDGEIVTRRTMAATISADHRVLDGADAARFLATFKSLLEAPEEMNV